MSFILDALRKSEHERQRQAGPDIAQWRAPTSRSAVPLWVLALGALLAVNLLVVAVLLVLRDPPAAPPAAEAATPAPAAQLPDPASATPASAAPPLSPQPSAPAPSAAASMAAHPPISAPPDLVAMPVPSETNEVLPTIHELNLRGAQALPTLHLDIHVYAVRPAERFVFINTLKYREGGQTPEGILIERITPQGVVLDRNGLRFLLPRR